MFKLRFFDDVSCLDIIDLVVKKPVIITLVPDLSRFPKISRDGTFPSMCSSI